MTGDTTYPESIEQINTADLIPYAKNAKKHDEAQVAKIAGSIREFGFNNPVLIDQDNGIIAGHGRVLAAQKLGLDKVPCLRLSHLSETQKRAYILADNKLAELGGGWDTDMLKLELSDLESKGIDPNSLGFEGVDLNTDEAKKEEAVRSLSEVFGAAPFSVLNARDGWWQDRKRAWIDLGIKSEEGREEELTYKAGDHYVGQAIAEMGTTSIFDPVLTELLYTWFCPANGSVLDPFAGGSVRGVVASHTGRNYTGIDLRAEQIQANNEQWQNIYHNCTNKPPTPNWITGDSLQQLDTIEDTYDFVFTCPPYADLEVYSEDPADISNMPYDKFLTIYGEIIKKAVSKLKPFRFAAIVVGEVRNKKHRDGGYFNFVPDTIKAFTDAGLTYYNEIILVTSCGTLPLRAGKAFSATRKIGKTHQNVLVFANGDPTSEDFHKDFRVAPSHQNILVFAKGDPRLAASAIGNQTLAPTIAAGDLEALTEIHNEI